MGLRPPCETFKGVTCKGSYALGSACGKCEKCAWERVQPGFAELVAALATPPSRKHFKAIAVCHDPNEGEFLYALGEDGNIYEKRGKRISAGWVYYWEIVDLPFGDPTVKFPNAVQVGTQEQEHGKTS